jgi:hypothetical protein
VLRRVVTYGTELMVTAVQGTSSSATDLVHGTALGVQVRRTLNIHGRNRNQSPDRFTLIDCFADSKVQNPLRSDAVQRIGVPSRTSVHDRGRYPSEYNLHGRIAVMSSDAFEFDVALSYAGEDRSLVEKVAKVLRDATKSQETTKPKIPYI